MPLVGCMNDALKLLPSQEQHAARLRSSLLRYGCALDASVPGAGKTYVACDTAARLGLKLAVIAPKATLPAWCRVAAAFGVDVALITNYENIRTGKHPLCAKSSFKTFSGKTKVRFRWSLAPDTLLVFDEVHRCRNYGTTNAQLLTAVARQGIKTLLCSATPFISPMDCFAIGAALRLFPEGMFWAWAANHGCRRGQYGWKFYGGEDELRRLHDAIFPAKGSRLTLDDIPEFPKTRVEARAVDTGNASKIQSIYSRMAQELRLATRADDTKKLDDLAEKLDAKIATQMIIILRARAAVEMCKVAVLAELAEDAMTQGESVAIFVNFKDTVEALCERLKCNAVITGGQGEAERQRIVDAFQTNSIPLVICNIAAGGVGVSLHDPTGQKPRLALISPTFSAIDLTQALGRVHRTHGASSRQLVVFADGTCEADTCERVAAKCANIALITDGDLTPSFINEIR